VDKRKRTIDYLQNITQKTKDRATRILLKPGHGGDFRRDDFNLTNSKP